MEFLFLAKEIDLKIIFYRKAFGYRNHKRMLIEPKQRAYSPQRLDLIRSVPSSPPRGSPTSLSAGFLNGLDEQTAVKIVNRYVFGK